MLDHLSNITPNVSQKQFEESAKRFANLSKLKKIRKEVSDPKEFISKAIERKLVLSVSEGRRLYMQLGKA